ncbi:Transposase, Tc1-like [Penicillium camemberti]|uniref:Transposase, Tc1-like n=1 Tax=Penicillium camemberti (strain FM 013) TaxID=1429867 RepID=A0A0G4PY68_PENC3|nr:Transposase, Tc1-like [Penicillium camemberti]
MYPSEITSQFIPLNNNSFHDIPRSTIQYTLTQESKRQKQESLPRPGQPRKLTEDDRDNIYGIIQEKPSVLTEDLLAEVDFKVHRQSIWRLTHQLGLRKWKKMHRPTLKPIHAEKRLCWALRWQHLEPSGWAHVYFSDECTVERGIGARQEWTFTRPKDQLEHHPVEGPQVQMLPSRGKQVKQMFWAAFCDQPRRSGLIPLDGDPESARGGVSSRTINELHRRVLPTLIHNVQYAIFQQDNAPVHTAHLVQGTLNELGFEVMEWPPYSPDLNPIENLWALLKAELLKRHPELKYLSNNEATLELLLDAAQEAWEGLSIDISAHLSETMPHRVADVIKYGGWHTSY